MTDPLSSSDVLARLPEWREIAEKADRALSSISKERDIFEATFSPPTVLALLRIVEEQRERIEELRTGINRQLATAQDENEQLRETVGEIIGAGVVEARVEMQEALEKALERCARGWGWWNAEDPPILGELPNHPAVRTVIDRVRREERAQYAAENQSDG
jgi:hypothetical protein